MGPLSAGTGGRAADPGGLCWRGGAGGGFGGFSGLGLGKGFWALGGDLKVTKVGLIGSLRSVLDSSRCIKASLVSDFTVAIRIADSSKKLF